MENQLKLLKQMQQKTSKNANRTQHGRLNSNKTIDECRDGVESGKISKSSPNIFASTSTMFDNVSKVTTKTIQQCINPKVKQPAMSKKKPPAKPICKSVDGNNLKIGDTLFIGSSVGGNGQLFSTEFTDYTLISNVDFTNFIDLVPKEIKPLLTDRWFYCIHVSHGMQLSVRRSDLIARVAGGEILAFKYTECSIEGNECAYYGFIPTIGNADDMFGSDTHRLCRFALQEIWPRKIYVYIKLLNACDCLSAENGGCMKCIITDVDSKTSKQTCLKRLPWDMVYLMMGDADETCVDQVKEPRQCIVCAQCKNCSKSTNFCRTHRVCKHKRAIVSLKSGFDFKLSKIKPCQKYKS